MSTTNKALTLCLAVAAVAASIGCAVFATRGGASQVPGAVRLDDTTSTSPRYLVIPEQTRAVNAPPLERRLAALAASMERRHFRTPVAALEHFDVEGLSDQIGHVVAEVEERAQVSVHVRDLATQHVLFDYYGDTPLNGASNHKLLTASAALDLLGGDYVFETRVARTRNDLYLVGEGDPTLNLAELHELADDALARVSVADIDRLVVDDTVFSPRRLGPGYSEAGPGEAYQAPSGALALDFSTAEITVYPLARGRDAGVVVSPASEHIVVRSTARTGASTRLDIRTAAKGDKTVVTVRGTVARDGGPQTVRRRVADPGLFAGATLAQILADRTQTAPLPVVRGELPRGATTIATHESEPLREVVDVGLAFSNNFMAEQLLRTTAWRMTGSPGDWVGGRNVLSGYWSALGNDPAQLQFENASGYSRNGRITTSGLVDLLSVAHRTQDDLGLMAALPVAGEAGTLRTRLRLSGKRVRAKTGTLAGVSGLSGVITSEDGQPQVGFSILTNVREDNRLNAAARRRAEDRIVTHVLASLDEYQARKAGIGARGSG